MVILKIVNKAANNTFWIFGAVYGVIVWAVIPASTWAIFESVGPMSDAIQNLSKRIYSEWFPTAGYERANESDMEVYPQGYADDENYRCDVWISVVRK